MNPGHQRIACVLAAAGLMLSTAQATRADVVLEWNAISTRTLTTQTPTVNAFAHARFAAIIQRAVFEAVNAITGESESYLGSAVAPARAPIVAAAGASAEAAAIAAAHAVLMNARLAAAAAVIAERVDDGSSPLTFSLSPLLVTAGTWEMTPGCPRDSSDNRILWTFGVALAISCPTSFRAGPRQAVPSQTAGAAVALPPNLTVAPVFQSFLDSMWRSSPTFRRQCRRLVAAHGLRVALRLEELQRRPSFDARTVFVRQGGVLVAANVFLSLSPAAPELIAHEVEHVLEQLDGVDLAAHVGSGNVWKRADGAFETRRATEVGRRVAREIGRASDTSAREKTS